MGPPRGPSSCRPSTPLSSPSSTGRSISSEPAGDYPFGLWTTDGTSGGTTEIKDLSQYGANKFPNGLDLGEMAASGSLLYFTTSDGQDGVDLWASNGTAGGTSLVMDFPKLSQLTPGGHYATISDMTPFDGKLAFIAHSGSAGTQLWITDGTAGGTQMLTDLAPPYDGSSYGGYINTSPSDLTAAGNMLYFIARTPGGPSGSSGLWTSDGTPSGTSELFPFPSSPDPIATSSTQAYAANLTVVGSKLFFSLNYENDEESSLTQEQLWASNGTASGTVRVPAPPYGTFSALFGFMAMGDRLLFQAVEPDGTELWASDGTAGRDDRAQVPECIDDPGQLRSTRQAASTTRGSSISRPRTGLTARSSGRPTARRPGPSRWPTSIPAQRPRTRRHWPWSTARWCSRRMTGPTATS